MITDKFAYQFEHRELIMKLEEAMKEKLKAMTSKELYNYYVAMYEDFDYKNDSFHDDARMIIALTWQYRAKIRELSYDKLLELDN